MEYDFKSKFVASLVHGRCPVSETNPWCTFLLARWSDENQIRIIDHFEARPRNMKQLAEPFGLHNEVIWHHIGVIEKKTHNLLIKGDKNYGMVHFI
jgi:hypothetical protein